MQKKLKWFAVLTTLGMLLILLGGALVTKTDSGEGCGTSWPLCHGQLIPSEITMELVIEFAHRAVSGSVGIMVLILSIWSWKKIGHIRETKFLSLASFIFLVIQALIGAAAVKWGQSDFVMALHFGISLISFASVFLLTLLIFEVDKKFEAEKLIIDKRMKFHMIGISVYSLFVVYTGALVRHVDASLVCRDWPLCVNDGFFMPGSFHEWVQMGHRAAAGLIFIWIAYVTYIAIKHYKNQKVIYGGWIAAFSLVSLQVIAGALVVITRLNLIIALAHAFFITCLFGVLAYFILLLSRNKQNTFILENTENQKKAESKTTIPPITIP
ncbi:COX15/CtaA family protein [Bacillus mesophilum]|uniref:Heme A synthase n=1 Tax=Bacillus mesophilum TaxID=1071718 RepID=A0A7V7RPP4_9BACI|nr:heme A synthase [Bacillus mesophilum]KAB2335280.1 heme A synthase [Bacillus mesophilum]